MTVEIELPPDSGRLEEFKSPQMYIRRPYERPSDLHIVRFRLFSRASLSATVIDTLNLIVFDAGPALPFITTPRYETVLISHCDPDHILGLFPYAVMRGKEKVKVFAPGPCAKLLTTLAKQFDIANIDIGVLADDKEIDVGKDLKAVSIRVSHLDKPAFAFLIKRRKKVLLDEYKGRTSDEMRKLAQEGVEVSKETWFNDVVYTGDLDISSLGKLPAAEFLITEVTYPAGRADLARRYGHLCEDDVDKVSGKYAHIIRVHESLGYDMQSHKSDNADRIQLGSHEG